MKPFGVFLLFLASAAAGQVPRAMRLVDSPYVGEGESRVTLLAEYERIEAARPGYLAPVGMIVGGVLGMGGGVASGFFGLLFAFLGSGDAAAGFFVLGILAVAAGIGLVIYGIVKTVTTGRERSRVDARLSELQERLERVGSRPAPQPTFELISF